LNSEKPEFYQSIKYANCGITLFLKKLLTYVSSKDSLILDINLKQAIKNEAINLGFSAFGVADVNYDPVGHDKLVSW
jgi:hypothetical protein